MANLALIASPRRVIIGGGVGGNPQLLEQTRTRLQTHLAGYLAPLEQRSDIDAFVAAPGLGANSGLLGAVALGLRHDAILRQDLMP